MTPAERMKRHLTIVGVDHAISDGPRSDTHGIVVAAKGEDGRGYVLADLSRKGSPMEWAKQVVAAYDAYQADGVVIERNQGGDLVRQTLRTVRPDLPIIEVVTSKGKHVRAEPIAALYGLGKVSHIGTFPELEAQMVQMTTNGYKGEGSPDRCDALVWAMSHLFPSLLRTEKPQKKQFMPQGPNAWMG
jgi:phage terminase large subunit-like protein